MSELKPCPFCGGQAETRLDGRWWVHCVNCTCEIGFEGMDENGYYGHFETEAKAIDAWNTRTERTCEAEIRESTWAGYTKYTRHCGNCGADLDCDTRNSPQRYCPNCGAKVVE